MLLGLIRLGSRRLVSVLFHTDARMVEEEEEEREGTHHDDLIEIVYIEYNDVGRWRRFDIRSNTRFFRYEVC